MLAPASPAFAPVSNATGIAQQLFPNARITSGYRPPDHPLSRANPKSWHTRSRAAFDIAPIPGMTFDQALQTIRKGGYGVIESRDEVKNPSRNATGPHWHFVLGKGR